MGDDVQRLVLLGSTGSIGTSTLNCVRRFPEQFKVVSLAAGSNIDLFIEQIREFSPELVYLADENGRQRIRDTFGDGIRLIDTADGLTTLVEDADSTIVVNALVGAVGLRPTVAALHKQNRVALANKETLVVGGDYITGLLRAGNGELLPVDSEHSAILQCLAGQYAGQEIESIILTASGGPFRTWEKERFASITPADALNHPTWAMGNKITIDAATLMNKGFEVIEAHHLFSMPYEKLRVCIHPQSIVHSMVEFFDGAVVAQMGCPDMELPIQYALSYPHRLPMTGKRLKLDEIGSLEFTPPDMQRFPCLRLCIEAGKTGGTAPAVLNAANEIAVAAFLEDKIHYTEIAQVVETALSECDIVQKTSLEAVETADSAARRSAQKTITGKG